jgi:hypothetical protein
MDAAHQHEGIDCVGIEADERYHGIQPAKSYPLYKDISQLEPRAFDLVVMSHVLEHMNHPVEFLQMLKAKYMHAGSLIMIEVPNYPPFPSTMNINHAYGFTENTLPLCLRFAGFGEPVLFVKHGLGMKQDYYLLGMWRA